MSGVLEGSGIGGGSISNSNSSVMADTVKSRLPEHVQEAIVDLIHNCQE